ncbi:unnamed protein product [Didymodactylos carnosus]|uniref:Uncharacterized protein n=1 Tax=Didymodactylos carnosus TaxID=1234261 RepID=A0A8S2IEN4_9BILA|nr:unnamed protein product [Didymodactylos carnosus]CAF3748747.1 unnamed protein product [Didymodactylos carnosus]
MIIKYIVYAFIITTTILATSTSLPKNDDLLSLNEHEAKDYLHEEKPHPNDFEEIILTSNDGKCPAYEKKDRELELMALAFPTTLQLIADGTTYPNEQVFCSERVSK